MARFTCVAHPERHVASGFVSIAIGAEGHPFVVPGPYPVCGLVAPGGGRCHSPLVECEWCDNPAEAFAHDDDAGGVRVYACGRHADALLSMAVPACSECHGPVDHPTEWVCGPCATSAPGARWTASPVLTAADKEAAR